MGKPEGKRALEIYIDVIGMIILKWILNNSDHSSQIFGGSPLNESSPQTNYVPSFFRFHPAFFLMFLRTENLQARR